MFISSKRHEKHIARKQFAENHIHPKLRRSLRLYLLISAIVLVLVIISMFNARANPLIVGCGLLVGVIVGIVFNRIYKISWDQDAARAVSKTDIYGVGLLVMYVIFDLSRGDLVKLFTHGPAVGATSLALLAGALFGRVLGTGKVIIRVFKEEKLLPKPSIKI
jgi:hypothetical protein